jgi:hypothetical protein
MGGAPVGGHLRRRRQHVRRQQSGSPRSARIHLAASDAQAADARTTVNEALAARLAARWGVEALSSSPTGPGCRSRRRGGVNPIREALGLSPDMRIVLFQGA